MSMIRIGRLAAVAVLAAGLVVAVPASPASAAACPAPDTGVTVIIDFTGLGGGTAIRCAPGDPASGLAALQGAGFEPSYLLSQPGFVCKIDGLPADACSRPPPLDAYWSYWYADRGGSWTYSSLGAASRDPAPGTVEGWAFGAGGQPGPAPPPPATPPEPPPEPPPGDGDREPPPAGDQPPPAGGEQPPDARDEPDLTGQPPAGPATGELSPSAPDPAPSGTAPPPPGGVTGAGPPAEPAASTATDPGGPAGVVLTAVAVAGLAGLGFWTARRRRRQTSADLGRE
jgi:hypothetical protein